MNAVQRLSRQVAWRISYGLVRPRRPAILMYHRIADDPFDPWGLAVPQETFAEQLDWLVHHRTVIPLAELVAQYRHGRMPRDAVSITFDDGYACAATAALPVLRAFNVHATVFISAGLVGEDREFWWDDLARVVHALPETTVELSCRRFAVPPLNPKDGDWAPGQPPRTARQKLFYAAWESLRRLPHEEIAQGLRGLRECIRETEQARPTHRLLTQSEMRTMSSQGISFGSHGVTHSSLPPLDRDGKWQEIHGSMERCAEVTGQVPSSFAYPYGDFDGETELLVQEAGFDCACTTKASFVTRGGNTFALPRLYVGAWNRELFAARFGGR